jgi:phosphoglycolate phosphatase
MPQTKLLVAFDMDGTLLDTRLDIARAANGARQELGLPLMSVDEVVRAVGDGVNLFVSRVTYPESHHRFAEARNIFLRHYEANVIGDTVPYPGIESLLQGLKAKGIAMAVVSNKPEKLVVELVQHFKWQHYFGASLGGDSAAAAKPDPAPIKLALERCGLSPSSHVIMVGDGPQDVMAAHNAGQTSIWCQWGFNPAPPPGYPTDIAQSPRQVEEMILNRMMQK